jgi:5-methylcytosine-specific restriction endonuclease McrA
MSNSIIGTLNQIKSGEVVLPAIQRDFVWREDQIQNLLDSILRGYPIGIVLMWETYNPLQYREFEENYRAGVRSIFKDSSAGRRLQVVLDGQQRLQSLYVAVFGTFEGRHLCFDVLSGRDCDDFSEQKYLFDFSDASSIQERNDHTRKQMQQMLISGNDREEGFTPYFWVKVSELFTMSSQSREQFVADLTKELRLDLADQSRVRVNLGTFDQMLTKDTSVLKLSVIDANLSRDSKERKTDMDVLEIFVRVNTGGTRLDRWDLIFSMLKLNWKESAEELPEFVDRINKGNSFGLTTDFVIRCLFVTSDLGATVNLNVLRKKSNVDRLRANFDECCKAISATVDFVSSHCWIRASGIIGGQSTLVPMVYYFFRLDHHRVPNAEMGRLRLGFFLLAFTGAVSRYGDSRINRLIHELKPLADNRDTTFPLKKVADWIHSWNEPYEISEDLIRRNPTLALHLVQGLSGGDVNYSDNLPEVDHIFPRATLRDRGLDESIINHFANFWILARGKNRNKSDKPPAQYFADVPDVELKRALIDRDLLVFDQYQEFIKSRAKAIVDLVRIKLDEASN